LTEPSQSKDLKEKKKLPPGIPMNNSFDLLRQNYCRPATVSGKRDHYLLPLEKECNEGKALLAQVPVPLLHLQEFDPSGVEQTYRDEATGAELPVFAVFNLEGDHQLAFEITTESVPTPADPTSLPAHLPFRRTQAFVQKINERRIKAERAITPISAILGIVPALVCLFATITVGGATATQILVISIFGVGLAYILSQSVLDRLCPWKKLAITAEFNGILPKEVREKARTVKDQFDNLYLIVDQQNHWKSALLPDPTPRGLDPLLIGELKQGDRHKFFLIHQFDLAEAEQYLADEFATKPASAFGRLPTAEI
jgi:hypothetical protein